MLFLICSKFEILNQNGSQKRTHWRDDLRHLASQVPPKTLKRRMRDPTLIIHRFLIDFGTIFCRCLMVLAIILAMVSASIANFCQHFAINFVKSVASVLGVRRWRSASEWLLGGQNGSFFYIFSYISYWK